MDSLVTAISAECCTTPEVSSGRLPTEAALRASIPVNTRVTESANAKGSSRVHAARAHAQDCLVVRPQPSSAKLMTAGNKVVSTHIS
eukprot:12026833-Alexandrium_andersonii.AAC.1